MKIATGGLDADDIINGKDLDKISEIPETPTEDHTTAIKGKFIKIDKSKIKLKKTHTIIEEPSS